VRILFKQRRSDSTDWFVKKAFSKPIPLLEKLHMIQERKELMIRSEAEKNIPGGFQPPGTAKAST